MLSKQKLQLQEIPFWPFQISFSIWSSFSISLLVVVALTSSEQEGVKIAGSSFFLGFSHFCLLDVSVWLSYNGHGRTFETSVCSFWILHYSVQLLQWRLGCYSCRCLCSQSNPAFSFSLFLLSPGFVAVENFDPYANFLIPTRETPLIWWFCWIWFFLFCFCFCCSVICWIPEMKGDCTWKPVYFIWILMVSLKTYFCFLFSVFILFALQFCCWVGTAATANRLE